MAANKEGEDRQDLLVGGYFLLAFFNSAGRSRPASGLIRTKRRENAHVYIRRKASRTRTDMVGVFLASKPEPVIETTHEQFVHAVRSVVAPRVVSRSERERLQAANLVYGGGPAGVRGVCYFGAWQAGETRDFIEIAAFGEESYVQLAGTTIHELAHCLAGAAAGHGSDWKKACAHLGLSHAEAAGQSYSPAHFEPGVWAVIETLPHPSDGLPQFRLPGMPPAKPRPCTLGIGTRGGRSRGAGSGSRLRLWVCGCPEGTPGRKVRVACDTWDATCNRCGVAYSKPV